MNVIDNGFLVGQSHGFVLFRERKREQDQSRGVR